MWTRCLAKDLISFFKFVLGLSVSWNDCLHSDVRCNTILSLSCLNTIKPTPSRAGAVQWYSDKAGARLLWIQLIVYLLPVDWTASHPHNKSCSAYLQSGVTQPAVCSLMTPNENLHEIPTGSGGKKLY